MNKESSEDLKALILISEFQATIRMLILEMKKIKLENLVELIPHVNNETFPTYLLFLRACAKNGIFMVHDLEIAGLSKQIEISHDYYTSVSELSR